ncbi:hypervirulence associated TUDOR domain-containing protein [Arthrobacter halodurans]|uniref:DUF2945 domain-containing protein n=1 Tax=Arthrobacter halodurans TaxID=516699 RepID=A0ABV4UNR5_9MICC
MGTEYQVGDHVGWNSEAGRITGEVTRIHTRDFSFMGRQRRASPEEPQYEVESDKTGNLAAHKGGALHKLE